MYRSHSILSMADFVRPRVLLSINYMSSPFLILPNVFSKGGGLNRTIVLCVGKFYDSGKF